MQYLSESVIKTYKKKNTEGLSFSADIFVAK